MKKGSSLDRARGHTLTEAMYLLILECLKLENTKKLELLVPLLHPSDCADLLEKTEPQQREILISFILVEDLGEVLANLNDSIRLNTLQKISYKRLAKALYELETDDIADVLTGIDAQEQNYILELIDDINPNERMQVQHTRDILSYPEHSAGRLMKSEIITAPKSWTAQKLLDYLEKESDNLTEKITTVFIINRQSELIGSVSMQRLARSNKSSLLKEFMRKDPLAVNVLDNQREVLKAFEKYDLFTCAVVDEQDKMVGQITVDDVLDLALDQSKEDILHMAGVSEDDDLFLAPSQTAKNRLPWLVLNLFTAILASFVISLFEDQIQQVVALAVLMPIIASMGGNAGTQTLAIIIRGLATDQITLKNTTFLLKKELIVGSFNGFMLGIFLAIGTFIFYDNIKLALVIFLASVINHIVSAIGGHMLPIALKKLGKDPAISAGIFLTTLTDVIGFFAFLGLASIILL
ncbi:MAG TPA: magnesium transporter [Alphaproteobacteria bacterium]|nr:magnesium transporter [Alphaproteobacteria bacterium]